MKLLFSPASPYARKVTITAAVKGVADQIETVPTDTFPLVNEDLRRENPLSKIPVLITDDGTRIFDSHVICEYLDSLAPEPRLFPASGPERFRTLTLGALADGILDAALLLVYEKRYRPEDKWVESWMQRQQAKIDNSSTGSKRRRRRGLTIRITATSPLPAPSVISTSGTAGSGAPDIQGWSLGSTSLQRPCPPSTRRGQAEEGAAHGLVRPKGGCGVRGRGAPYASALPESAA